MLVWNYLHQVPSKSKETSYTIIHVVYELDSPVGNVRKLRHVGGISSANKNRPPRNLPMGKAKLISQHTNKIGQQPENWESHICQVTFNVFDS